MKNFYLNGEVGIFVLDHGHERARLTPTADLLNESSSLRHRGFLHDHFHQMVGVLALGHWQNLASDTAHNL